MTDSIPSRASADRFVALPELLRAAARASDPRRIVLAALGLILLWAGWRGIEGLLGPLGTSYRGAPMTFDLGLDPLGRITDTRLLERLGDPVIASTVVIEPALVVVEPFSRLFLRRTEAHDWFGWLARGLWALVVWGLVGGAIARVAVVREATGGGVGIASAVRFALRRSLALVGAPLTPFVAVAVLAAGCALFGLVLRLPTGFDEVIARIFGFVPLLLGLALALILLKLALAWPLMIATVAAEGEDVGDALSRSYSYVNQRLARLIIHLGLASFLGVIALVAAVAFARVVLGLADWGVALGAPSPTPDLFRGFWSDLVSWLVHAYAYSYFWTVIAALYLVLRRDVDGTDPHDVDLPEHALDTFAGPVLPEKPSTEEELPA